MKVIGLTGGIGSGKSFVADVAVKYFPILHISTDEIARQQMQKGGASFDSVVSEFSKYSENLLTPEGEINRQVLGKLVLDDPALLKRLDEITHPPVIEEVEHIIKEARLLTAEKENNTEEVEYLKKEKSIEEGGNIPEEMGQIIAKEAPPKGYYAILIETALLYEAGIDNICDEVWYVYAPMATRRKRLKSSRGYSDEKIDGFLARQNPEEEFLRRATRTVPNGDDVMEDDMVKIIKGYLYE